MTDEELEAIRARAEAATPGPWFVCSEHETEIQRNEIGCGFQNGGLIADCCIQADDGRFIAHAREDIPALLAEIERIRRSE